MAWQVVDQQGLYLPQIDWWLDARQAVKRSFISHAHYDHLGRHREILCSLGTARLLRERLRGKRLERVVPFGVTVPLAAVVASGDPEFELALAQAPIAKGEHEDAGVRDAGANCTACLYPAGHILGSAQLLLTHPEFGRLLYTGDFKLRPGLTAEVCAAPRADTLIMETTFGLPRYLLPPAEEVQAAIVQFCQDALAAGETPVLLAYSLGKTQEVLAIVNAAGLPVMLHPQAYKLTEIYRELGQVFTAYRAFDPAHLAGQVVICSPQSGVPFRRQIPRPRTAMITGWALDAGARYRFRCDAAFPLSDHADYADLLRFVELVQPSRVFTVHGFATEFARTLRARGIEAWALGKGNQLDLALTFTEAD